jgi:hypothetical protein
MIETTPYSLFKTVFLYSALILFAPISTFFGLKYFFFEGASLEKSFKQCKSVAFRSDRDWKSS